jgi:RNA-directed DNA polymerase
MELKGALEDRTYKPSRSVCFFATRPKLREIFAADFRDRIVHHILVDYLERIWEPIFIHDSYACRRGKGVHQAVTRLRQFVRKVTKNGTYPAFFLQLDIKNYFMTIDKDILFSIIAPKLKNDEALWLLRTLVYHDCTADYHFRGNVGILNKIPPHKSLFKAAKNKGLPIGNLNSQFFANVYLNLLDQFVKHQLKCRYYLRYCDDFVLLSRKREELTMWKDKIVTFIDEKLQLELRKSFKLQPVSNGIDFLGYIVRTDYLLVRRRVVNNLHVKLREYKSLLVKEGRFYRKYLFDEEMLDRLHAILSSYLGHFKMANTYNLCKSIGEKHTFLDEYFDFDPNTKKLVRKYKHHKGFRRTYQQYMYYRSRFKGDIILFQVGRFFEFYHIRDKEVAQTLGLSVLRKNKRRARYGFPINLMNNYLQKLLIMKMSITLIFEKERYLSRIKERAPIYRYEVLSQTGGS